MKHSNSIALALYPNTRGFGYALLESPSGARDCGIVTVKPVNNQRCLNRVKQFIDYYEPTLVILRSANGTAAYKGKRTQRLIRDIVAICHYWGVPVKEYSREQVRFIFEQFGATTKYQIAATVVKNLPQLKGKMPPVRKPWMCEDYNMGIFDAIALAITHFYLTS